MKKLTEEQQRYLVHLWDKTGPEFERIRREELRNLKYNWRDVDALLEIGANAPRREEDPETNSLVLIQQAFMAVTRKQGLLPHRLASRETPAPYGKKKLNAKAKIAATRRKVDPVTS